MSAKDTSSFTKLNAITSISQPSTVGRNESTSWQCPQLIILCSWMGAANKHIAKYTAGYQKLYPQATILLVQSTLYDVTFGPDLSPAYEVIRRAIDDDKDEQNESKTRILLHAFSNGGANNATQLLLRFKQRTINLPIDWMIFDSCPGRAEVESGVRAMTLSIPNYPMARLIGSWLVYLFAVLYKLVNESLRRENFISWIRRNLNDPGMIPRNTPRLYFCSKGDDMVDWQHVKEHADEARQQGFITVRELVFQKAPHCALLNEDAERYWTAMTAHIDGKDDHR